MRAYRVNFFKELSNRLDVDFIESSYPKSGKFVINERLKAKKDSGVSFLKQSGRNLKVNNSDFSIFCLFKRKYTFVVFSGILSFPFLALSIPAKLFGKKIYVFDELWSYPKKKHFKYLKPLLRFYGKYLVDGFILASSKAKAFNHNFLQHNKPSVLCLNTHCSLEQLPHLVKEDRLDRILFLGRVVEIKGLDLLIKAIEPLKNTSLDVYGDGDYLEFCKELVQKLELTNRVKFKGACEKENVNAVMQAYKYFCLPSKITKNGTLDVESWGFTVNEALSNGCLVIASDSVGSSSDLIEAGLNGEVFQTNSIDSLRNAIKRAKSIETKPKNIQTTLTNTCSNEKNAQLIFELINEGKFCNK